MCLSSNYKASILVSKVYKEEHIICESKQSFVSFPVTVMYPGW